MIPISKSQIQAVVLAALLVFSGLAVVSTIGPVGAANIDTETANSGTQSDLTDSTTITDYNGSDTGNAFEANVSTQNDSEFRVISEDGDVIHTYENSDLNETASVDTGTDGNDDAWYKRINSSQVNDALKKVPVRSGENVTVTFRAVDNASLDASNETYADANITLENVDGRIVARGDEGAMTLSTINGEVLGFSVPAGAFFLDDKATASMEESDLSINGSGTTYTLYLTDEGDNTTISERFGEASSDAESEQILHGVQLQVNNRFHPVYHESAPSGVSDSDTYGVYDSSNDTVDVNIGDEYDSEDSVDITITGNDELFVLTRLTNYGALSGLPVVGAFLFFVVTPYGLRRLRDDGEE